MDTIAAFAHDTREFLLKSDLTKSRTFVKAMNMAPGRAVIRYSTPMPQDSRITGKRREEAALARLVPSTVNYGGPERTELRTFRWEVVLYST